MSLGRLPTDWLPLIAELCPEVPRFSVAINKGRTLASTDLPHLVTSEVGVYSLQCGN